IENQQWTRYGQREVALKKFDGIVDINEDFLNEMVIFLKTNGDYSSAYLYGITKDPKTHEYMMLFNSNAADELYDAIMGSIPPAQNKSYPR
ncbi:26653_t:CDS:2, partial [Dentiscutata erythropus]